MVNIDTVYQKVLNFASKEQRGYITPQEFNLFANQAQLEIFEQYFYDVNNFEIKDANHVLNDDVTDFVRKKLDFFITMRAPGFVSTFNVVGNAIVLPDYVYRVTRVEVDNVKAEYVHTNRFKDIVTSGPLVRPTKMKPIYSQHNGRLTVNDGASVVSNVGLHFYRLPVPPLWNYFVVSSKALYNSDGSVNFELHPAEEVELVYKILKFAGVSMQRTDILQAGQGMETMQIGQEKQ
tara:strand:+ start:145 stop:849 length:705 start_codon:yes stop_codon:yes gene_type:complete